MHGWLAKMRGTLIGDEELRTKGMKEMTAARVYRQREAARKKQYAAQSGSKGIFSLSFLGISRPKPKDPPRVLQQPTASRRQHGGGSTRPSYQSSHRHDSRSNVRSSSTPAMPSRRTSHQGQRQDSYHSQRTTNAGQRRSSRR
ncbi:hypothetical protein D9613_005105 [Agrocybe pediades]|uniref:Uncharacterized protein n=1 Tax=Agrocybe pediades TaxID=84607 RepID=A0A8H4VT45_9AGAR|nr:hypothetical protein D9613_005105 [Agrocybe pediades]